MNELWLLVVDRGGQQMPPADFQGCGWSSCVVYGDWRVLCDDDELFVFNSPDGGSFLVGWGGQREGYWVAWRVVAQMRLMCGVEPRVYQWDELAMELRAMVELLRSVYAGCDVVLVTFVREGS